MRTRLALLLLPVCLLSAAACGGQSESVAEATDTAPALLDEAPRADQVEDGQSYRPDVLRYASISGADEESTSAKLKPIIAHVGEQVGMEIEFIETTDYSSVIEAMRAGRVDFATFGPFSYVIASTEANAEPLVALPNQKTGELGYKSLIITNAASDIESIADLEGRSMAFADPASTSGHLFPRLMLSQEGIDDPEAYFSETIFSGGHDASLVAVANNKVDAAGVCDTCIDRFFREGLADEADIKVIAESDTIPPSPLTVREDLDPELKSAIADAYLALVQEQPELVQAANSFDDPPTHPYAKVADADYDIIRELADRLSVDLSELD